MWSTRCGLIPRTQSRASIANLDIVRFLKTRFLLLFQKVVGPGPSLTPSPLGPATCLSKLMGFFLSFHRAEYIITKLLLFSIHRQGHQVVSWTLSWAHCFQVFLVTNNTHKCDQLFVGVCQKDLLRKKNSGIGA